MPAETGARKRQQVAAGNASAGARDMLFARLHAQPVQDIGRWAREDLYEDEGRP